MAFHTSLDQKFMELLEAKQSRQSSRPKIQEVPEYFRNRNNIVKYFSPKSVSIGPIHHNTQNLKLGENYKLTWAAKYIQLTQQSPKFLHKKILDNIDELKDLYADKVLAYSCTTEFVKDLHSLEEKLAWVLFVDGCFLMYILMYLRLQYENPEDVNTKVDRLDLVMKDVLLLENQLPYLVLKLLWKDDNEDELIYTMMNFLNYYHWAPLDNKTTWRWRRRRQTNKEIKTKHVLELPYEQPIHLLDLQRKIILNKYKIEAGDEVNKKQSREFSEIESKMMTYRNIEDLTTVGIKLKSSGTRRPTDINFSEGWFAGKLTLPQIVVDDDTAASFLNLIAYEMCPDFKNDKEISSFVVFLNSLIDHAEDVKILRSKGILVNSLESDEEVANLFNNISTDLIYNPEIYFEVRVKIHEHHFNTCKIWLAQGYHNYFSNPWAIIGFFAALIALTLTFVQTWFTIFPR
ncbi:hypothetical protein RYX36_015519 [Vicia faba]